MDINIISNYRKFICSDKLMRNFSNATIFQTKEFSEYMAKFIRANSYQIILREDNEIRAILTFFKHGLEQDFLIRKKYFSHIAPIFKKLFPIFKWTGGPLIKYNCGDRRNDIYSEYLNKILDEVDNLAKFEDILSVSNVVCSIFDNKRESKLFIKHKYKSREWGTFIIDLTMEKNSLWYAIKKDTRKIVKRTIKKGVKIEIINKKEVLYDYARLIIEQQQRMGEPLSFTCVYRSLNLLMECLKKIDGFYVFMAMYRDMPISALGILSFNGILNEISVANSNFALKNKIYAQDLIKWEIIKWGHETGKRIYDLTGVNPNPLTEKEKGIYRFKSKWGGELVKYNIYSKYYPSKRNLLLKLFKKCWHSF